LALANELCLAQVDGGWAIALKHEKGEPEQLSFPFACMETAQQFLSIAKLRPKIYSKHFARESIPINF
jgi:hypothetical protein